MFAFSEKHPWQGNEAVQQILVFSSQSMKELFEHEIYSRNTKAIVEKTDVNDISDSNAGAIYKLRALRENGGMWKPVIRCGFTGELMWEDDVSYTLPEIALAKCMAYLKVEIAYTLAKSIVALRNSVYEGSMEHAVLRQFLDVEDLFNTPKSSAARFIP